MSTYRGPAVLITDDGDEFTVGANLASRVNGLESWGGKLTIGGQYWDLVKNRDKGFTLRIGQREAPFMRPNPSEMPPAGPDAAFFVTILGSDNAPF